MTGPSLPPPRTACEDTGHLHLIDALRDVSADRERVRRGVCELWRVLGPEVPLDLTPAHAAEWSEALRTVRTLLTGRTEGTPT